MLIKPTTKHIYVLNEQQNDMPLPPNTALKYRISDTSVAYVSKSSANKIYDFYSQLAQNDTFSKEKENSIVKLFFKYRKDNFMVTIVEEDNNSNFIIDIAD